MNTNTALLMFALIAAFGLATATLALPIVHEANAQTAGCTARSSDCQIFGQAHAPPHPTGPP
jgi:hypothetical protein